MGPWILKIVMELEGKNDLTYMVVKCVLQVFNIFHIIFVCIFVEKFHIWDFSIRISRSAALERFQIKNYLIIKTRYILLFVTILLILHPFMISMILLFTKFLSMSLFCSQKYENLISINWWRLCPLVFLLKRPRGSFHPLTFKNMQIHLSCRKMWSKENFAQKKYFVSKHTSVCHKKFYGYLLFCLFAVLFK